jgi:hypothetical protein
MAKLLNEAILNANIHSKTAQGLKSLDSIRRDALESFTKARMRPATGDISHSSSETLSKCLEEVSFVHRNAPAAVPQRMEDREN